MILAIGSLATLATSAPVNPVQTGTGRTEVEAGEVVGVDIVLNEAATEHVREHPMPFVELELQSPSGLFVPSEDTMEPRAVSGSSQHHMPLDCSGSGSTCALRTDFEANDAGTLRVLARVGVMADGQFLFPENRDFGDDAIISVRFAR